MVLTKIRSFPINTEMAAIRILRESTTNSHLRRRTCIRVCVVWPDECAAGGPPVEVGLEPVVKEAVCSTCKVLVQLLPTIKAVPKTQAEAPQHPAAYVVHPTPAVGLGFLLRPFRPTRPLQPLSSARVPACVEGVDLGDGESENPQQQRWKPKAERPEQMLVLVAHHRKVLAQEQLARLANQRAAREEHEGVFEKQCVQQRDRDEAGGREEAARAFRRAPLGERADNREHEDRKNEREPRPPFECWKNAREGRNRLRVDVRHNVRSPEQVFHGQRPRNLEVELQESMRPQTLQSGRRSKALFVHSSNLQ